MKTGHSRTMIDPPSGWKYGFPKALELDYPDQKHTEWLVNNGYPQAIIDKLGDNFWCRYWNEENT